MSFQSLPKAVKALVGLTIVTFIARVLSRFFLGKDKAISVGNAIVKLVWTYLILCVFYIISPNISEDYLAKGTLFAIGTYALIYHEIQCIIGCADSMDIHVPKLLKKIGKKDIDL